MIVVMSPRLIDLLPAAEGRDVALEAGAFLFHTGDPVATLFVVLKGEVRLVRHQEGGGVIVLQRAGSGMVLAEASLFSSRYHCDAVAAVATCVKGMPMDGVRQAFRMDPAFAVAWARHLALEVQGARFRAEVVALRTVAARLDAWLGWRGGLLPRKGEWKQVADQIGVSPEALYRELARRRRP
jgi:CRP-like cAMP-binding protein